MLALERREAILNSLYREKRLYVAELSARFDVTEETIRRDLEKLEKKGYLTRTYGGALSKRHHSEELPYEDRRTINRDLKQAAAARASAFISEGDTIMIDSTSTSYELLSHTDRFHDLTIITNSARISGESANSPHRIITLGGELRKRSLSFCGSLTEDYARHFNADVFFFSCRGLDIKRGITEATLSEARVKQAMMRQCDRAVLLLDHTKFDKTTLVNLCAFDRVDTIVTDKEPSAQWQETLERCQVELLW